MDLRYVYKVLSRGQNRKRLTSVHGDADERVLCVFASGACPMGLIAP